VDVYDEPGPGSQIGSQIHDMNPSHFPPTGLFWTLAIDEDDVEVNLGRGTASMEAEDVPILDYGTIQNALFGGGPAPVPGSVSFRVTWGGAGQRVDIRNTDPIFGGFAGTFIRNAARMAWTAKVGPLRFESAPLATSSSSFAEIGHERNGIFFQG
jgi:hypothetical protein